MNASKPTTSAPAEHAPRLHQALWKYPPPPPRGEKRLALKFLSAAVFHCPRLQHSNAQFLRYFQCHIRSEVLMGVIYFMIYPMAIALE